MFFIILKAAESRFIAIFEKAKTALEQHPKNAKRFNRVIYSNYTFAGWMLTGCFIIPSFLLHLGSDEESKQSNLENQSLRPTRTAKSKATQHLVCFQ